MVTRISNKIRRGVCSVALVVIKTAGFVWLLAFGVLVVSVTWLQE